MKVEFYERARFKVTSHGETRMVDLLTDGCNGSCDCPHFLGRLKPAIKQAQAAGSFVPSDKYRCPHIDEARKVMLDFFLKRLASQFPDNEEHSNV